jgi:hypothetical protein
VRWSAIAAAATLVGGLAVLLLPNGADRAWWFRGFVALVGILSTRSLVVWIDAQPHPQPPAPFRRRRRRWRLGTGTAPARPSARLLQLATFSAGDAHRGLRPVLQEIADERLRANHGVTLDDAMAPTLVAPATWALLRGDRPPPHDLRAPGLSPDAIDAILTDLERL